MNCMTRSAISFFVVLVAATALASAASAVALRQSGNFPKRLVGTWTRTASKADIKRAHVPQSESGEVFPGAVYTLTIQSKGTARLLLG